MRLEGNYVRKKVPEPQLKGRILDEVELWTRNKGLEVLLTNR